jgi:hypothetical protein
MNASSGAISQGKIRSAYDILRLDFERYLWLARELMIVSLGLPR